MEILELSLFLNALYPIHDKNIEIIKIIPVSYILKALLKNSMQI